MRRKALYALVICCIMASCSETKQQEGHLESGVEYRFIVDAKGASAEKGKIVEFDAALFLDTLQFVNTFDKPSYCQREIVGNTQFSGDLLEVLHMVSEGDSIEVKTPLSILPAEAKRPFQQLIQDQEYLRAIIKVRAVWDEKQLIDDFIAQVSEPSAWKKVNNGVRMKWDSMGEGDHVQFGDSVKMLVRGRFFSGAVFQDEVVWFEVGSGRVQPIAWEIAAFEMREGDKVTIIAPYQAAYGDRNHQKPYILRFSTLLYEIDLLEVKRS